MTKTNKVGSDNLALFKHCISINFERKWNYIIDINYYLRPNCCVDDDAEIEANMRHNFSSSTKIKYLPHMTNKRHNFSLSTKIKYLPHMTRQRLETFYMLHLFCYHLIILSPPILCLYIVITHFHRNCSIIKNWIRFWPDLMRA